jgi:hypothetical protein
MTRRAVSIRRVVYPVAEGYGQERGCALALRVILASGKKKTS